MSGSARFAVAVHVLAVLGRLEREGVAWVPSEMIAKSVNTNAVVIRNLLRSLKKAGLVESREGKGGGARLAKRPTRISLDAVYTAVETDGLLAPNDKQAHAACPVSCKMGAVFDSVAEDVENAVAKVLRGKTLEAILARL